MIRHLKSFSRAGKGYSMAYVAVSVLLATAGVLCADVAIAKSWPCGPTDKEFTCYDKPCKVGDTENGGHCVGDKAAFGAHRGDKVKAKR